MRHRQNPNNVETVAAADEENASQNKDGVDLSKDTDTEQKGDDVQQVFRENFEKEVGIMITTANIQNSASFLIGDEIR